jgi:hypothetical protein
MQKKLEVTLGWRGVDYSSPWVATLSSHTGQTRLNADAFSGMEIEFSVVRNFCQPIASFEFSIKGARLRTSCKVRANLLFTEKLNMMTLPESIEANTEKILTLSRMINVLLQILHFCRFESLPEDRSSARTLE